MKMTIPSQDDLVVRRLTAVERLGQPFEFRVELQSKAVSLNLQDFPGRSATVHLELPRGGTRHFNGIVTSFGQTSVDGNTYCYQAVLRPWFWLLTRTADCRIFQKLSVPDIFKKVCSDLGFTDYKLKLAESYSPREYCVQYRETAFAFLSRLLEAEGIYYYFAHEENKQILILSDGVGSHQPFPGYESIPFVPVQKIEERVETWSVALELQPGKYALNDFDFQKPNADLNSKLNVNRNHPHSNFEIYDYPGGYDSKAAGDSYVKARVEEQQSKYQVVRAGGDLRGLATGCFFQLTDHPSSDQNQEYLVVSTVHHLINPEIEPGCSQHCEFEAIPSSQTWRPPRITPAPKITGPQTAIVTGKSGNEIWTDNFGRIKVQFHWDRLGMQDENSSCWIRVAQSSAGKKWGSQFLPRMGQEVVVEFLEGNPDHPLVTGSVYNGNQPVPFALPDNATQSGVRTRSSKGGDEQTFNEMRFEDKKGSEEIYIHAEKDLNCVVENNETRKVGFDDKKEGDQTIEIYNNQVLKVGKSGCKDGSQTEEIFKDRTITLKTGDDTLTIKQGSQTEEIFKDRAVTLKTGNDTLTLNQGDMSVTLKMGNQTTTLKLGNQTTKLVAGASKTEAMQGIEFKVGANSIKIDPSGITIKGIMVKVEGSAMAQLKSPKTTVAGDGMLTVKGGITMIN